jgi:hypothetical protein
LSVAQAPDKMSYQAIIRDQNNAIVANKNVGSRISILQGTINGTAVYVETHSLTTNANGLISLEIGNGTVNSGSFALIDWANGPYFIKSETDPEGGSNYVITGTSQLLSVPFALHANTVAVDNVDDADADPLNEIQILSVRNDTVFLSQGGFVKLPESFDGNYESLTGVPTKVTQFSNDAGYINEEADGSVTNELQTISKTGQTVTLSNDGGSFTDSVNVYTAGSGIAIENNVISVTNTGTSEHYIGELFGGGIIFWLSPDKQHGLIASLDDLDDGNGAPWGLVGVDVEDCENETDGAGNTAKIIAAGAEANSAAALCNAYEGGGFTDWYLPATRELYFLCTQDLTIDYVLDNDGDPNTNGMTQEFNTALKRYYWSSTQVDFGDCCHGFNAWACDFSEFNYQSKSENRGVRAIRAF